MHPELVNRAEPAEARSIGSTPVVPPPIPAEGNAVAKDEATVTFVIDGDTIDVALTDGAVERVRLPQIDTSEVGDCGYEGSTAALDELIAGENVALIPTDAGPDRDSNGRLLRAVEIDGDDVGQVLLRNGLARWVRGYAHEDTRLAAMYEVAEIHAREDSAGFWSTCAW